MGSSSKRGGEVETGLRVPQAGGEEEEWKEYRGRGVSLASSLEG